MKGNFIGINGGLPGDTYTVSSSDTAKSIDTAKKYFDGTDSGKAAGAIISVESNSIRCTFGTTPTTSLGHLVQAGERIVLDSWKQVDNFKFISAVSGLHATLMITIMF